MDLLKSLQETNMAGIDKILKGRKVGPAARQLVETGVLLNNSSDPAQRQHGLGFLRTAVKELEPEEEPDSPEAKGLQTKGDGFEQKELLGGNDSRQTGSEQSSEQSLPFTGEGSDAPNSDIEGMGTASGENQMKEEMPIPGIMPGMDPRIAEDMGKHMGKIPAMNTPQQMQQMQYMISNYHKKYVAPLNNTIKVQRETIQKLAKQIQETQFANGSRKLDLDGMRNRSAAFNGIHETVPAPSDNTSQRMDNTQQDTTEFDKNNARQEISEMNKRMNDNYIQ